MYMLLSHEIISTLLPTFKNGLVCLLWWIFAAFLSWTDSGGLFLLKASANKSQVSHGDHVAGLSSSWSLQSEKEQLYPLCSKES